MNGESMGKGRILLVEDEPHLRLLLTEDLRDAGYVVTGAPDGLAAQAAMATGRFELVLTDIQMPGMNGLELTGWLREHYPSTGVILMTGYGSSETVIAGLRLGADDYLMKPFGDSQLVAVSVARTLEKRRLEREARALRLQLANADHMAAIGQLASAVAHEINNPAGYVTGYLCMLQEDLGDLPGIDSSVRGDLLESVGACLEGMDRIGAIASQLRVFSRSDLDVTEAVDIQASVRTAVMVAKVAIRHHAELETDFQPVPDIRGHAGRLAQAFLNLLVVAGAAAQEGSAGRHRVSIRTFLRDQMVAVQVRHTGRPLPPAAMAWLDGPATAPIPIPGLATGLAAAREVIDAHRGRLSASVAADGAAYLDVSLPIGAEMAPETRAPEGASAGKESRPNRPRILVIDDEPLLCLAYQGMLRRHFEVVSVDGGAAAIALLEVDSAFDAVICDLMMPGIGGDALFEWVTERLPALARRVVFATGGAATPEAKAFLATVENRTLYKPFAVEHLVGAIEAAMTR